METGLGEQLWALLAALPLGAAIGLLYDLLRPLRRSSRPFGAAMLDVLFSALAGCGIFVFAMGADNGRMGLWELAAALAGFLIYMNTLSTVLLPFFTAVLARIGAGMEQTKILLKKTAVSAKNFFPNVRKCFIIKRRQ